MFIFNNLDTLLKLFIKSMKKFLLFSLVFVFVLGATIVIAAPPLKAPTEFIATKLSDNMLLEWKERSPQEDGLELQSKGNHSSCNEYRTIAIGPDDNLGPDAESISGFLMNPMCTSTPSVLYSRIRTYKGLDEFGNPIDYSPWTDTMLNWY